MSNLNRRKFLAISAGSAGALLLHQCSTNRPLASSIPVTAPVRAVTSQGGLLEVTLAAEQGPVSVGGRSVELMSYNGQIPGPLLEVRPGDTVQLRLDNRLPESTNLHFHGLHVPPEGNADNIFLEIPAGEAFSYEFTIPARHPGGTFYYHPHYHGLVGRQVFGGLGGIFVVRGELDQIPEIQAARETFLFLKDIDSNNVLGRAMPMQQMLGREGDLLTVNGQQQPTLDIDAGGLLRLRLVNASAARFYRLSLDEHPFYLIATDGGAIASPVELSELLLAPGERAEVLIKGDRPAGNYRLTNLPYNRGGMGMMGQGGGMMGQGGGMMGQGGGMRGMGRIGQGGGRPGGMGGMGGMGRGNSSSNGTDSPQVLATLTYTGETTDIPLPTQLVSVNALPEAQATRQIRFSHGMAPGQGMVFLINNRAYSHDRIDTQVRLNTVEDWDLINPDMMDHPFHIHTNPFQIIHSNGVAAPYRAWKDTVLVRAGETVRIRTRFDEFTGKSLYHCHILDHEDLGMAGILNIQA